MNRSTPSFRRLFSSALLVFLLVSCGGKAESDFDVLKKEGEASGEEIPVGTYDPKISSLPTKMPIAPSARPSYMSPLIIAAKAFRADMHFSTLRNTAISFRN